MAFDTTDLRTRIARLQHDRLKLVPWEKWWWLSKPARVRIAIYAEGSIRFDGGSFDGLQHVIGALQADPWWWVKFDVTLIHRGADPSADQQNKRLDQIDLDGFDELWLFGFAGGDLLTTAEKNAVHAFMDAGGGVLHTGDHASLGAGIAGAIQRVGKMRLYPAPPSSAPVWNTTLREGPTPGYQFADQSDDVPQRIRLRRYPLFTSWPVWSFRSRPHPVLCGKNGPIDVFPDHQHEGEAIAPTNYPAGEWPSKSGYQPKVEVIAWGRIVDPAADKEGEEIGLVSAYDGHRADVGRILADSTWHHWFDINLDGFAATVAGSDHLGEILDYFLNCAVWLATPSKQRAMRNAMLWGSIWRHPFPDWSGSFHPRVLGGQAFDVFGRYAPKCTMRAWLLDLIPVRLIEHWMPVAERIGPRPVPLPIEEVTLGAVLAPLVQYVHESGGEPPRSPDLDLVEKAIEGAAGEAIALLHEDLAQCQSVVAAAKKRTTSTGKKRIVSAEVLRPSTKRTAAARSNVAKKRVHKTSKKSKA